MSTDPVVATIFATESSSYGIGVVHIVAAHDLAAVRIIAGNVLAEIECEVGVELRPAEFVAVRFTQLQQNRRGPSCGR